MSNRNGYLPSINAWSNPDFKGDVTIEDDLSVVGDLSIGGNSTFTGTSTFIGNITLPTLSLLKSQTFEIFVPSIVSGAAAKCVVVSRLAGPITNISAVVTGTIATADLTLTATINGVAITTGTITIANLTAAETAVSVTPTALNTVARGDVVKITVGGGNTATGTGTVTFQVTVA